MKAKLIQAWACAPEGHTIIRFQANHILEGDIARMALSDGVAIEHKEVAPFEIKQDVATMESEAPKKRGRPRKEV